MRMGGRLLFFTTVLGCARISADKPEGSATVIGNPGDMDMSVGTGEGALARSVEVSGAMATQFPCEGDSVEVELDDPLDLTTGSMPFVIDTVCAVQIDFEGVLRIEGEGEAGGTFVAELDIPQIKLTAESGFKTEDQDYILEFGSPGWLDAAQLGLDVDREVEVDAVHPAYPALVAGLTEHSQIFADDGDGLLSEDERAAGAVAATQAISNAGVFVVVGDDYRRAVSVDAGETWTFDQTLGSDDPLWTASYGQTPAGDLYIAAGGNEDGIVMTSLDGQDWTQATVDDAPLCGMAYGDASGFVLVGYGGHRLHSDDGIVWADHSGDPAKTYKAVAYGDERYVAVGLDGHRSKSLDGETWGDADLSGLGTSDLHAVAYGDGRFVAVGQEGLISVSEDGVSWTDHLSVTTTSLSGIAFGGGIFVAVGESQALVSEDGESWEVHPLDSALDKVVFGAGVFMGVGVAGVARSEDGAVWTSLELAGTPKLRGVAFGQD